MIFPGDLTDVPGLKVGHHTDARRPTGCTVVLCEPDAVASVDVRGAAPGTRETDLLQPDKLVERVHAVLLTGGSAFGLDAATGVMRWLQAQGRGFEVSWAHGGAEQRSRGRSEDGNSPPRGADAVRRGRGPTYTQRSRGRSEDGNSPPREADAVRRGRGPTSKAPQTRSVRVPIVPAAVLFDLWLGDPLVCPDADAGHAACLAAHGGSGGLAQGNVGAGAGATVGKLFGVERAMKGGIGSASLKVGPLTVGALIAVNAVGDVIDPDHGRVVAGARTADGQRLLDIGAALRNGEAPAALRAGCNTTIGIIGTDALLTKAQARHIAAMAHDGLARTINPAHTMIDGDTLFALGTGRRAEPADISVLGALAAEVTARAVLNAVRHAGTLAGPGLPRIPAARDLAP